MFVLGLAMLVDAAKSRLFSTILVILAVVLLLWNALFLVQYRFQFIPMGEPLTWSQLSLEKLTLTEQIWTRLNR